ncbi:component of the polarisome, partial [Dimargaris verticillata]
MASTHVKLQTFRNYITSQLSPGHPLPQPKGNGKLSRLQEVQFQVLVSDVYDELIRRTQNPSIPHLIARSELNAKRNQAREKLSSLGAKKFFDLVCEVYTELERRRSHAEPPTPPADSPHHPHPSSAGRNGPPMRPPPGPAYGHSHNHGLGPARGPSPGPGSHPRPPRDHYPNSHRQPPPRPALDDSYRPPKPPSMDRQRTYDGPSKENSHAPMPLRSNPSLRSNGSAPSIDSGYYNGGQRP